MIYCPNCGNEMAIINVKDSEVYVCKSSVCRTTLPVKSLNKINVMAYATISMTFEADKNDEEGYYVLLKSDTDEPVVFKNTNKPISEKNRICVIKAKSKANAIKQFKDMYEYIDVNEDTVRKVRLTINKF